jgi:hypothetical protein
MHALSLVRVYQIDFSITVHHAELKMEFSWNCRWQWHANKNGNTSNYGLGLQNGFADALTGFITKYARNLYHPLAINRTVWDLGAWTPGCPC